MSIIEPIRAELMQEASSTRRMLQRLPEDKFSWKPHPKSMSLAQLASHIAEIPEWATAITTGDELDIDMDEYAPRIAASRREVLEMFETNIQMAAEHLEGQDDGRMLAPWRLKMDGETKFEMPRIAVVRAMVLNHLIHHRGQLSVYLRLNGVPLPAVYGPTADEEPD